MSMVPEKKIPKGWRWIKLSDVCENNTGIRDPKELPNKDFYYVDISSVSNVEKKIIGYQTLLGSEAPSRARKVIRANDIIVATTRPNLNAVAKVPHELDDQICSTGFCVLRAGEDILPDFLFAFVRNDIFINSLSALVIGALYPAVSDKQVKAQLIPLPPISEQKRIVAILNRQMEAVERARKAAEERYATVNGLPDAYLRKVFPLSEENLPKGWNWTKLTGLCEKIDYGFTASATPSIDSPRFLRITDIQNGKVDWAKVPGCEIPIDQEDEYRLYDGDIVFARTGATTGKSFLVKNPPRAIFASYLIRIRVNSHKVDADFLANFFLSARYWQQVSEGVRGGAQGGFNASMLRNLIVSLPPLSEQKKINEIIGEQMTSVVKVTQGAEEEVKTIDALPSALLRKAFSGEL